MVLARLEEKYLKWRVIQLHIISKSYRIVRTLVGLNFGEFSLTEHLEGESLANQHAFTILFNAVQFRNHMNNETAIALT